MAGTDLAVVAQQLPAYLREAGSSAADEFHGGLAPSFPLAFLSVRGKEFRLRKDGQELNTRQREINAVFVAARGSVSKRLYTKKYESGTTEAPECSSKDSITPDVANPVAPDCRHCPKNQWGSRITEGGKEGKACQDYKRLVLWLVGLTDDPVVLDVAATSLKAPKDQTTTELMLGGYLSQLAKHGMDPTQVVTKIAFTDAEYPQLCFNFERFVSEDEFKTVLDLRGSDDVKFVVDEDVFEPGGEVKETSKPPAEAANTQQQEAPAPEKTAQDTAPQTSGTAGTEASSSIPAFPGKTTVMKNDAGELTIAEDETQYAVAWSQGFRPAQTSTVAPREAEKPKAEEPPPAAEKPAEKPAQEAPADDVGGESDLLSQVSKLLGGGN